MDDLQIFGKFLPGNVTGYNNTIINNSTCHISENHMFSMITTTDCVVYSLSNSDILHLIEYQPEIYEDLKNAFIEVIALSNTATVIEKLNNGYDSRNDRYFEST